MDRDEAIRRAEVAMAWARGETVQWRRIPHDYCNRWRDMHGPSSIIIGRPECGGGPVFFDGDVDWRIKPKPLEFWVWVPDEPNTQNFEPVLKFDPPVKGRCGYEKHGRWVHTREIDE